MDPSKMPPEKTRGTIHFPRTLLLAVLTLAAVAGSLYKMFGSYDEKDRKTYEKVVGGDEAAAKGDESRTSRQRRTNLQKNFYFGGGPAGRQLKLTSASSELSLEKSGKKIAVVEQMQGIEGWMQERFYTAASKDSATALAEKQDILHFTAREGSYHYIDETLSADGVVFSKYTLEGRDLDAAAALGEDSLPAEAKVLSVAADRADYGRDRLVLTGQVKGSRPDGTLQADRMVVEKAVDHSSAGPDRITMDGNVVVQNEGLTAAGDHAVYTIELSPNSSKAEHSGGVLNLTGDGGSRRCSVVRTDGSVIRAVAIDLDTATRSSRFYLPEGQLKGGEKGGENGASAVDFSADEMVWDDRIMTLIMNGNIDVVQDGIGRLQADKELTAVLFAADGKKRVRTLEAQGNSTLTYIDPEKSLGHTLKCFGRIKVDHVKMESQLHSPKDAEGNIIEGLQVFFQDEKGDVHADRAFIKYEEVEGKLAPVRLVLEGNVKIINRLARSTTDLALTQQYILADRVDFIPKSKEMIFKAEKGRRVLLYDKNNNMEVSAPSLKLVREQAATKETLQGIGGVRLNFVEGELDLLRRRFLLDKKP